MYLRQVQHPDTRLQEYILLGAKADVFVVPAARKRFTTEARFLRSIRPKEDIKKAEQGAKSQVSPCEGS